MDALVDGIDVRGIAEICHHQSSFRNVVVDNSAGHLNNAIDFGFRSIFNSVHVHFKGCGNKLIVENHCRITGRFVFDGDNQVIRIGANTSFERASLVCSEGANIYMGRGCMLSYDIEIRNSDSHAIFDLIDKRRINPAADVVVGDHVWIGMGCGILSGVTIASGSVIGMKSVVTKNLDSPNSIYAGVPAKKIRDGVIWSRYKNDVYPQDVHDWLIGN